MVEETLTESINLSADSTDGNIAASSTLSDGVELSADNIITFATLDGTLQEVVNVTMSVDMERFVPGIIVDSVTATIEILTTGVFVASKEERLSVSSRTTLSFLGEVIESITASSSTGCSKVSIVEIVNRVTASEDLGSKLSAVGVIVSALMASDAVTRGMSASVIENAAFSTVFTNNIIAATELVEQSIIAEHLSCSALISIPIDDQINLSSDIDLRAILSAAISDGLCFTISFDNGGYQWQGWCMNADNFGVTGYGEYPFNSFAKIDGKYYGANSNGLYLLEGSNDDGEAIPAKVMLAATDFDEPRKGTIRDAWLGLRSDGEVFFKTLADDNKERWYRTHATNEHLDRTRVKLSRGVRSNYWQVGLENIDGADFELSNIELIHVVLSRH
jgi:hypothetical protein